MQIKRSTATAITSSNYDFGISEVLSAIVLIVVVE